MNIKHLSITLYSTLLLFACTEDDQLQITGAANTLESSFVMATNIGETAGVQGNSYLQHIHTFDSIVNNSNALENTNKGTLATYKNQVFYAGFFGMEIKKYEANAEGLLNEVGVLAVPNVADILIIDENKGYILQNMFELKEFNPSTFEITKSISLQEFNTKGKDYPFSRAGEMCYRPSDKKLFITLHYIKSMRFQNIDPKVSIATVDTKNNSVLSLLEDDRSYSPGMLIGSAGSGLSMDAKGDIYIACSAGFGFQKFPLKSPGILRIQQGKTVIDPDYFLDLQEVTNGNCVGLYCLENGQAYTFRQDLSAVKEDFSNVTFAAAHQPVKIDLTTKSLVGVVEGYPRTSFLNGIWMQEAEDGESWYLPANSDSANGVYRINTSENKAEKLFETVGKVTSLEPLQLD